MEVRGFRQQQHKCPYFAIDNLDRVLLYMSRAIPANFNQYLLDQTSRNTGVVCDGGIMPLRNDQD